MSRRRDMQRDAWAETAEKAARERLDGRTGRAFWRGLEELADSADFRRYLEAEFPSVAPLDLDRRSLLKAMGASLALAGLAGCSGEVDQKAMPYVVAPEFVIPGIAKWYATAVTMNGYAQPVLGKTFTGRPVKLEGNPDHPVLRGGSTAFIQAALLGLYDPDRSQAPRYLGRTSTWNAFETAMVAQAARLDANRGEGFRLLTGTVTSPTLARQIGDLTKRWPQARWHVLEPAGDDRRGEAARLVFGRPLDRHLRLDAAEVVVSLDDDILGPGPHQAIHGRLWSARRAAFQSREGACRLLVAEPTPSLTGVVAADRLIAAPGRIAALAGALGNALGAGGAVPADLSEREQAWLAGASQALDAHRGRSLVTIGAAHPPEVQALGLLINEKLGNLGRTIRFMEPVALAPPDGARSFEALAADMDTGRVSTLTVIDANPVYASPGHLNWRDLMEKVGTRLHAGLYYDETASLSHWHVPLQHELETWSDARGVDGIASVIQPLVRPFYDVRSVHVLLQNLQGQLGGSEHAIVRETWQAAWGDAFEESWTQALQRGFIADTAPAEVSPDIASRDIRLSSAPSPAGAPGTVNVVILPDPTVWDGRYGNNAWLQELPKPLTKVTWDNVILVSPQLAARNGIQNGDAVRLETEGQGVTGAAWIMPGQEADTVTLTLGYGRGPAGRVVERLGYDAYRLRRLDRPWHLTGVALHTTDLKLPIATTQLHAAMDGFDFVRVVSPGDQDASKQSRPELKEMRKPGERQPSFYPVHEKSDPSWGMSIDLDTCIGCNACVVACVAENNIPMVGKELVAEGREMHWLRIDRYYEGEPEDPKQYFQPVPCMHCEQAPCEMGCPVNAAVHSFDGLNLQVYNRCIGTRTCSSFCPYKVRHFNWFDYTREDPPEMQAVRNPNVTVRSRGVMEKCTYCVQRISDARIQAKKEGRPIREGEVVTACQQACPTSAIVFGNVSDPDAKVSRLKASPRDYSLLEEVNTWPRTTYLARIEEEDESKASGGGENG